MLVLCWSITSSSTEGEHLSPEASYATGLPEIFMERRGSSLHRLLSLHICRTLLANTGHSPFSPQNTPPPNNKIIWQSSAEIFFKMMKNVLLICWRDILRTNSPPSSNTRPRFTLPESLIMCCRSRMPSTWRNIIINFVTLQYEQCFSEICSNCAVVWRT